MGARCSQNGHFGRFASPLWFLNLAGHASASRVSHERCFRQAHCFVQAPLRFLPALPNRTCARSHIWGSPKFFRPWGSVGRFRLPLPLVFWEKPRPARRVFRAKCPGECPTGCSRKWGGPREPFGPRAPECQKGVPRVSLECQDTFLTLSGHLFESPEPGARRALGTPRGTLPRTPPFSGTPCRTLSGTLGPKDSSGWSGLSQLVLFTAVFFCKGLFLGKRCVKCSLTQFSAFNSRNLSFRMLTLFFRTLISARFV